MDSRNQTPEEWFPIEIIVAEILVRMQYGEAKDIDRWFLQAVFDRICRRGCEGDTQSLLHQMLGWESYEIVEWVNAIKGRYLVDDDIEIATALLKAQAQGLLGPMDETAIEGDEAEDEDMDGFDGEIESWDLEGEVEASRSILLELLLRWWKWSA
jgi:hypothetical protein